MNYRSRAPEGASLEPNTAFKKISSKLVCEIEWKCTSFVPLTGKEPMHMKEMRSVLHAVRLRLSRPRNWNERFLVFGDNLGVVFAVSKGRCTCLPLLFLQRNREKIWIRFGWGSGLYLIDLLMLTKKRYAHIP